MPSIKFSAPQKSGLLLIDKPADFSSHDIIAIARRILHTKKIGHSGTLDPMATGLLILLIGREATVKQPDFLGLCKTYWATLKLGEETDTWDKYGDTVSTAPVPAFTAEQLGGAVQKLSGHIKQLIPPFSAKKIKGEKMYDLARKGVELAPRFSEVTVSWADVKISSPIEISFTLTGTSGTYVRALGYMLARELGTVGHLIQLRRLSIGPYRVEQAFDGNLLKDCQTDTLYKQVLAL